MLNSDENAPFLQLIINYFKNYLGILHITVILINHSRGRGRGGGGRGGDGRGGKGRGGEGRGGREGGGREG